MRLSDTYLSIKRFLSPTIFGGAEQELHRHLFLQMLSCRKYDGGEGLATRDYVCLLTLLISSGLLDSDSWLVSMNVIVLRLCGALLVSCE